MTNGKNKDISKIDMPERSSFSFKVEEVTYNSLGLHISLYTFNFEIIYHGTNISKYYTAGIAGH